VFTLLSCAGVWPALRPGRRGGIYRLPQELFFCHGNRLRSRDDAGEVRILVIGGTRGAGFLVLSLRPAFRLLSVLGLLKELSAASGLRRFICLENRNLGFLGPAIFPIERGSYSCFFFNRRQAQIWNLRLQTLYWNFKIHLELFFKMCVGRSSADVAVTVE
jgi:hypothetical protein